MSQAATARRSKVPHPPPKRERQKGGKTFWAYKPPKDIEQWLEAKCEPFVDPVTKEMKRKFALSNFLSDHLEFFKEFEAELGSDWWELVRRADEAKVGRGKLAAQLVRGSMKGSKR